MKISQSETRDKFPLSTRKIIKKTVSSLIVWVVLVILWVIIFTATNLNIPTWAISAVTIAFLVIALPTYFYHKWYFSVYYYDLGKDYIVIKKGPITPQEITIPYERVQDVYVDQDLLDRIFGIYDVHLSSATISSGMEAHIDGVEKVAADGLKAVLLDIVSERISKKKIPTTL